MERVKKKIELDTARVFFFERDTARVEDQCYEQINLTGDGDFSQEASC
jgi:hypothetical protein